MLALVHGLALRTFYAPGVRGGSSLQLDVDPPELGRDADDVTQTKAHASMREQYERLRASLPESASGVVGVLRRALYQWRAVR
jgi:hypothetical protein